jgi:hypothetical protein
VLKIVFTKDLAKVAKRLVWFKEPEKALADPYTFMAHVMTYGSLEDIIIVKRDLGNMCFQEALDHVPPGIMDPKSWVYWNLIVGKDPSADMPERKFDN